MLGGYPLSFIENLTPAILCCKFYRQHAQALTWIGLIAVSINPWKEEVGFFPVLCCRLCIKGNRVRREYTRGMELKCAACARHTRLPNRHREIAECLDIVPLS